MRKALLSGLLTATLLTSLVSGATPAGADPALSGAATAYGLTASVATTELIPPTPSSGVTAPPFGADNNSTLLPLDVDPLAVNGTLIANSRVHEASDLTSDLEVVGHEQDVAGPYNAQAVGAVEDVEVLIDTLALDTSLLEADAIRSEAVAKCVGDTVQYAASSEVVNLGIAGEAPLNGPLNDLVDEITSALNASPLAGLVTIAPNVVTVNGTGATVDALVISVLPVLDPVVPLVQVRIGHAAVAGVACGGGAGDVPACSDTADNDDDGVIDADDPGCHTDGDPDNPDSYDPEDDDESDEPGTDTPECRDGVDNDGDGQVDFPDDAGCQNPDDDDEADGCSDGVDNDGDGLSDIDDPGCHTDGDATNPASYDRNDDDEADAARALPLTGASVPTAAAVGLGLAGLALVALRRRAEA